jgi:transposase
MSGYSLEKRIDERTILSMSMKEREWLKVFSRIETGELKLVEAAGVLGLSYRQSQRMIARYREEGDGGIVHRSRGRPSNRGVGKRGERQC